MTTIPYAPPPVPARLPLHPSPLPEQPCQYTQMLRGPRRRWWRGPLSLLVVVALVVATGFLLSLLLVGYAAAVGAPDVDRFFESALADPGDPAGFAFLNLLLAALIPASALSIWLVHRIRPRYLSSVAGGIRWRWLVRCVLVIAPVWLLYLGIGWWLDPADSEPGDKWVVMLVLGLLLTPFQAAGEEYLYRGWIMQNVGSYFARPTVGLIVSLIVSAMLFALSHGSLDPWILGTLSCIAVAAGIATQRTGGLEAAIAIHAVNNVLIGIITAISGGYDEALIDSGTTGDPIEFLTTFVVCAAALALILWQAKRRGIDPYYRPVAPAAPPPPTVGDAYWNPIPSAV